MIVCPYFDYRQLTNQHIVRLVEIVKQHCLPLKSLELMNEMKSFATQFRSHFPLIVQSAGTDGLIYFDNGATTQKPQSVIDAITDYYTSGNANVHRATHGLAQQTTQKFEDASERVRQFIGVVSDAKSSGQKGRQRASIWLLRWFSNRRRRVKPNLVLTEMEHHANFVPWQVLAKQHGIEVRIIPVLPDGCLDSEHGLSLIDDQTLVVASWPRFQRIRRYQPN